MKNVKSLSLFSADTLDSLAMAEVFGGADNCNGGNCVTQCACSKTVCDNKTNVSVPGTCVDAKCGSLTLTQVTYDYLKPALTISPTTPYVALSFKTFVCE